jgi:ABC-type transport system substrate-binding protein/class 3 adenylate cyclase
LTEPSDTPVANRGASGPGIPAPGTATDLRTFLIADIRGYTTYTREHGDEAAAALASRFAELVEEVVREREGFVVELRGDEALVVFVSARRALRAAMELQARFKEAELPRGVGIGLDAGEAIPVGAGYRGTALNLAARLCAAAGPGETLASETVIHLAAKMDGIAYVDARAMKLKGYGEAVRVVDVVPTEQAKGRRMTGGSRWADRGRGRYAVLAAGVVAALIVVAVVANALGVGPFSPASNRATPTTTRASGDALGPTMSSSQVASVAPSADPFALDNLPLLAFYDGETTELKGTAPFPSPRNIAFFSAGSFWVMNSVPMGFSKVDPETHVVAPPINVPIDEPNGFNIDDKAIWVTDLAGPIVHRIDLATGTHREFSVAEDENDTAAGSDIAVGDGSIWVARPEREELTRMDAETGDIEERINVVASGVSYGEDGAWYVDEGRLGRIDPSTNKPAFEELELGTVGFLGNVYPGNGYAWTTEPDTGTLWRVDRSGRSASFPLEPGAGEIAFTSGLVWVTNGNTGELVGLDVTTGQRKRVIDTGHATLAVVSNGDELLIAVGPTVDEVLASVDGNILKISTPGIPWFDRAPDPATNGYWEARQGMYLTCLQLVNYPDEPAPEGWSLRPEAAEAMPTISDDGRTYEFKIKSGFAFSPPSNEPVTARTFKGTIERLLSPVFPDEGFPGPDFYGDIAGAAEFRAGSADDVSGIVADGDVLTITLNEPSPTFLDRLALSFACAVPVGTPALRSGLNPTPPVSGAGPYYVADHWLRSLIILKKNPNYTGPRPQPFDAITIRMRMSAATAVEHVQTGVSDAAILPPGDPLTGSQSAIALEWGPGSTNAEAGDQRWFGAPRFGIGYLALNQQSGPFTDPDVRHAVALAVDRTEITSIFVTTPTDNLYLPGMPGTLFPDESAASSDPEAALELMAGRTFDVTMLGFPEQWGCRECQAFVGALTRQLKAIGINVTVLPSEESEYPAHAFEPGSGVDMVELGTGTDVPELTSLIGGLRDDGWLGDDSFAQLDRLDALTGQDRIDGANAFAQRVVEENVVVPYGYQTMPFFVGDRIGCGVIQPAIGAVDLLKLCVEDGQ